MTFAWASQNPALRQIDLPTLQQRFSKAAYTAVITTRQFTSAALPCRNICSMP